MNGNSSKPLTIEFIPSLEFAASIDSAGPGPVKEDLLNRYNGTNPWRQETESIVSPFEQSDLDLLFSAGSTVIFLFYTIIERKLYEPESLISFLNKMTEKEFFAAFQRFLGIGPEKKDWINTETIEQALILDRNKEKIPFKQEAGTLAGLLSSGDVFRKKLVEVLSWYYERFFLKKRGSWEDKANSWINRNRNMIEKDPKGVLDRIIQDSYSSLTSNADVMQLFPITESANSDIWLLFPDNVYCIFTIPYASDRMAEKAEKTEKLKIMDKTIEALSDPKRVTILRLLRERPYFSRELASTLGISPSTASYHVDKLVASRLVRLHVASGRRFYYAINPEGFHNLILNIKEEFITGTDVFNAAGTEDQ